MKRASALLLLVLAALPLACISLKTGKSPEKHPSPTGNAAGVTMVRAGGTEAAGGPGRTEVPGPRIERNANEPAGPVYTPADVDAPPVALERTPPELREGLRRLGPGTVRVAFLVDEEGKVRDPFVQSSTDPAFEAIALEAVRGWSFKPGERGGEPVRVRMGVPVTFNMMPREVARGSRPKRNVKAGVVPSWASTLSGLELSIWNDPRFKEQFAQSYIAETEIEPSVTVQEREDLQEVLDLISSNKMAEAADLLESGRNDAASAVYDFTLANIYFQQDQLDKAAKIYKVAVEKFPKFRRAWKNLGLIHIRVENFEEAIPALTRVVELGGGDAVTYGLIGFADSHLENSLSAESAYRMAILLDPNTVDWKMGLARSLFKQQRYADAVALCGSLIKTYPDRVDLWLLQANAFIGLNRPLKAAENYEMVDSLGKSTKDSLNNLADIYINEELYGLAVDAYIRSMEKDPDGNGERALRAAQVLVARGALDDSRKLVETIETMYGSNLVMEERKNILKLRARIAVASDAGDEEARVLERIVELDPLDGEALILLGRHANRNGDPEKAIFYYERAEGIQAFEADAKVRHAQLLVGQGKYEEALPLLRRAQLVKPRSNIQEYLEQVERVAQSR